MATLKTDTCSACSLVIPTMQPAMTAADLFTQWMSSASHNTPASAPFLSTFSQTPPQHYPAGHTLPQPMQPPCTTAFTQPFAPIPQQQQQQQLLGHTVPQPTQAPLTTSAFTQPPSFHTFNTPHHSTAMPGFRHHRITPQPQQILSSHHHHNMDHSSITSLHHIQQTRYQFNHYQPHQFHSNFQPLQLRHQFNHYQPHQLHSNFQPLQLRLHQWVTTSTIVHDLAPHARSTDINKFPILQPQSFQAHHSLGSPPHSCWAKPTLIWHATPYSIQFHSLQSPLKAMNVNHHAMLINNMS